MLVLGFSHQRTHYWMVYQSVHLNCPDARASTIKVVMLLMENVDSKDTDQRSKQPKLSLFMNIMSAIFAMETGLQTIND